jgi:site-specific DNA-methyltransferase (adenine-specific)
MTAEPYYSDERVTLYHGDALDIMPALTPGTVDLVLTDPPYVIGAVSAGNMASKAGGWADMMNSAGWFTSWYRQCDRLLRHTGSMWTFCNWRSLPVVMRAALDAGMPVTSLMVWDKQWIGPGGSQGLRPSYELCALLAKPGFAVPDRGVPDLWQCRVGSYKPNGHPAEKPLPLFSRVVRTAAVPTDGLVLDPFAGSGTTAIAARTLGIRSISIEAEEQWCELIAKRLSQDVLDFGEVPA